MKPCSICKIVKPLEEFRKQTQAKDKLSSACRYCLKIQDKIKRDGKKSKSTLELLGWDDKNILKFLIWKNPLATEENWFEFQIDHIRPCHSFKNIRNDEKEQKSCFHWTNLHLLPPHTNISKNAKYIQDLIEIYNFLAELYFIKISSTEKELQHYTDIIRDVSNENCLKIYKKHGIKV